MSEYGNCNDCGATGGHHYNDCDYDGINSGIGYSRGTSDFARGLVLMLTIFLGSLFPPIGFVLLLIFINM